MEIKEKEDIINQSKIKKINRDIDSLNKFLLEIKRNRRYSEKIETQLSKRKQILNNEEIKIEKHQEIATKLKESKEKIKVNLIKNKEILEKKKQNDKINLERQKTKNNQIKQGIDNSLKSWKNNLKTKNKEEADKIKEERKLIENIKNIEKKEVKNYKRQKHDLIIMDHLQNEEKKKNEEKKRKLQIKKQLENKIKKEIDLKQLLDDKINRRNKENDEIVKRIKDYNPQFQIIEFNKFNKKRIKSSHTPKAKKITFKNIIKKYN